MREQFELERRYHFKLLAEPDCARRRALYVEAYSQAAPGMARIQGQRESRGFTGTITRYVRRFLIGKELVDIGSGYGKAAREFASLCKRVIGVEVNPDLVRESERRADDDGLGNVSYRQGWATETGLPDQSIDVFYSNDLVEHLHPDDFDQYLSEAIRVLRPGGLLIFLTANGLFGPHDISKFFIPPRRPAEGLHLNEPTFAEIERRLRAHGFVRARAAALPFAICRGLPFKSVTSRLWIPIRIKVLLERLALVRRCKLLARLLAVNMVFVVAQRPR
jgi:SAM-dependent methyltransferase